MYRYMGFILFCSVISNSIDMELYREKENKKSIKIKLLRRSNILENLVKEGYIEEVNSN